MTNIHEEIKDIILNHPINTQMEIASFLKKKGIQATQSKISRALKKIGIIKQIDKEGKTTYKVPQSQLTINQFLHQLITNIEDNGHVIIIKTHSGAANTVGQLIDEHTVKNILGTIAGDNAVLIIPRSTKKIKILTNQLRQLLLNR